MENIVKYTHLFSRVERGVILMTSYDFILKLIEMLLAEKEANNQLRQDKEIVKD